MAKIYKAYDKNSTNFKVILAVVTSLFCIVLLYFSLQVEKSSHVRSYKTKSSKYVHAATWNIAAINNNPFEYWITPVDKNGLPIDDPTYIDLMSKISAFIEQTNDKDIPVEEVFTEGMYSSLEDRMSKAGWEGLSETRMIWENDLKHRKIISQFIKDSSLGKKRLASMPDRVTNTINAKDTVLYRPTIINCYDGSLNTINEWWESWIDFVFNQTVTVERNGITKILHVYEMFSKIKKSKYPSISIEEESISIPLQTVCLAIFDAILLYMINDVAAATWQPLRQNVCNKLNRNKINRTIDIIETSYPNQDIIFLQEVGGNFPNFVKDRNLLKMYEMYYPSVLDDDRDQNSFILLKKNKYMQINEVTGDVMKVLSDLTHASGSSEAAPIMKGDLLALTLRDKRDGTKYLLGSFHGDTNGLATKSIVSAIHAYASSIKTDHKLIFGLDANTYANPDSDQQGVKDFAEFFADKKLNSCYGQNPNPLNFTTFHARTHLQPQLNKVSRIGKKILTFNN